jgi:protein CpxP
MSKEDTTSADSEPSTSPARSRRSRWRRAALWIGIPAVAAGLLMAPRAFAGHHGCGGGHGFMHGAESADEVSQHMQRRLGWMLSKVDATDAQQAEAKQVLDAAVPDLFALSQEGTALRVQLKDALLADQLDLAAIQGLTDEAEATVGQAARMGLETVAQISAVLEPEQRRKIQAHLERFMH